MFGKGRREREVGIHPDVGKLLWKYIHKYRKPKNPDEKILFLGATRSTGHPLSSAGVKQMVDRVKKATGIANMRVSPHVFRHTFAKMYLQAGGDIFSLSREMGHSSVQITNVYLQDFTSSDARRHHTTFSPINNVRLRKNQKRKKKQE